MHQYQSWRGQWQPSAAAMAILILAEKHNQRNMAKSMAVISMAKWRHVATGNSEKILCDINV